VVEGNALVGIITAADILDAFVQLSGVAERTYRIALGAKHGKADEAHVRAVVGRLHGELKWLHYDGEQRPPQVHLRLKVRRVDELVTGLEAAGFDVISVVAPARKR
jgi:CBS domain-containing protein